MATLDEVWRQQIAYNHKIRSSNKKSEEEWMTDYILGTISELGELLKEVNWKHHRSPHIPEFGPNTLEELADITKYIISMWQLLGVGPADMLEMMWHKGEILNQLLRQEKGDIVDGRNVLILDLDGVISDFRSGFIEWLKDSKWSSILAAGDSQIGLHLDINNGWGYPNYEKAKLEFEEQGGYSNLPHMKQEVIAVQELIKKGWYVAVYTARPYSYFKRIWKDTWTWLLQHGIKPDALYFGYTERVLTAEKLHQNNHVVAMEDDPILIHRYSGCGIHTFMIDQPYNEHISNSLYIHRAYNLTGGYLAESIDNIKPRNGVEND